MSTDVMSYLRGESLGFSFRFATGRKSVFSAVVSSGEHPLR